MDKSTKEIRRNIQRYKGHTSLIGIWLMLFFLTPIMPVWVKTAIRILCIVGILLHSTAAHIKWKKLKSHLPCRIWFIHVAEGFFILWITAISTIPIVDFKIKSLIAGIGIPAALRLRLLPFTKSFEKYFTNRREKRKC